MRTRTCVAVRVLILALALAGFTLPLSPRASFAAVGATEGALLGASPAKEETLNPGEAFSQATANAEKGDARAMLALGSFYEQGVGTPRNYTKALYWYQKAADAGLAEGWYNVGVAYEIGMGNAGDMKKAVSAFRKAADMSQARALRKLAALYFEGESVSRDYGKAVEYLAAAAAKGDTDAANSLGAIYLKGLYGQPVDEAKGFEYFLLAADGGNLEAIKNIAVIFKDGIGRGQDPEVALQWYLIAQKGGYKTGDLGPVIAEVKSGLTKSQTASAEQAADKWLQYFREKRLEE